MKQVINQYDAIMSSPIGMIGIRVQDDEVSAIDLALKVKHERLPANKMAKCTVKALQAYFDEGKDLADIQLYSFGTGFQNSVWQLLRTLKMGEVMTYGEVAKTLQTSPRAVGQACRTNPCPLLTPCHRVVSASGLGGFSGATKGEWPRIKEWLLKHEGYSL